MAERKKEKPIAKKGAEKKETTAKVSQSAEAETKTKRQTVTTAELAMLLNLSIPSIKKLQSDGVIEPLPNNGNRKAGNQWMPLPCACKVIRNYQKIVESRGAKETDGMREAKERERTAKAKQAELNLAEREGELVNAEELMQRIGGFLTRLRINLLSIPKGIAPLLRNMDNSNVIAEKIRDRLDRALIETIDFEKKDYLSLEG